MAARDTVNESPPRALESWKAIAAHLNRSERTVRRWELTEGLPVHRHQHDKGATVYAHRHELDRWLEQRRTRPADEEPPGGSHPATRPGPWIRHAVLSCTVLLAGLALTLLITALPPQGSDPSASTPPQALPGPGQPASTVAIAQPVVRGSDSAISAMAMEHASELFAALARSLEQTPGLRRGDILPLLGALEAMGREPAALADPALAAEAMERAGGISAVLVPLVDMEGRVLEVSLISLQHRAVTVFARAPLDAGPAPDAAVLTRQMAAAMARNPPAPIHSPAAGGQVQTRSLVAFRRYAAGERLLEKGHRAAALSLLRDALEEDPGFVMARAQLDWEHGSTDVREPPPGPARRSGTPRSTDAERYYALAARRMASGDPEAAWAALAAHLELAPDSYWGHRRALSLCNLRGARTSCVQHIRALAAARPRDPRWIYLLARDIAVSGDDLRDAEVQGHQAARLLTRAVIRETPDLAADIVLFPARLSWLRSRHAASLAAVTALEEVARNWPSPQRDVLREAMAHQYLALGRLGQAEQMADEIGTPGRRERLQVRIAMESADPRAMARRLSTVSHHDDPVIAFWLAAGGQTDTAAAAMDRLDEQDLRDAEWTVARARLEMARGHSGEVLRLLEPTTGRLRESQSPLYVLGMDLMAAAHRASGDLPMAVRVLESTRPQGPEAAFSGSASLWRLCQLQLTGMYRQLGRENEADTLEATLAATLEMADPGHPLSQAL